MIKASPPESRESLKVAQFFAKHGIMFVCIPCVTHEDVAEFVNLAMTQADRMDESKADEKEKAK